MLNAENECGVRRHTPALPHKADSARIRHGARFPARPDPKPGPPGRGLRAEWTPSAVAIRLGECGGRESGVLSKSVPPCLRTP